MPRKPLTPEQREQANARQRARVAAFTPEQRAAERERRAALRATPMPPRIEPEMFRLLRLRVGLSQIELARKLGTREATISNRERVPCGTNTRRIWLAWEQTCAALGRDPDTTQILAPSTETETT